jgi:nitrous oxide reductase accessory protein NosL
MDPVSGQNRSGVRSRAFRCSRDLLIAVLLLAVSFLLASCGQQANAIPANAQSGRCPVCGMNANSNDDWAAELYYSDGTKIIFESLADLLLFYTAPKEYKASELQMNSANVTRTAVKDYKTRQVIDARDATLVYESRVQGPMGADCIPFAAPDEAREFAAANGGRVLRFQDITRPMAMDLRKN